jgi:hypothetical protein
MSARKEVGAQTPPGAANRTAGTRSHLSPSKTASGDAAVTSLRSVTWAVEHGSQRDLLVALRDKLWEAFNDERTQPRDLSPLTLRLKELQAEIEAIDLREEVEEHPVEDGIFDPESI